MILTNIPMPVGSLVGIIIVCVLAGLVIGFFVSRFVFKKELKKNPPITINQIKAMYAASGRTLSEKQARQIQKSMEEAK